MKVEKRKGEVGNEPIRLVTLMASVAMIEWAMAASAADLATVNRKPAQFLNQRIEITAPVIENSALKKGEFRK